MQAIVTKYLCTTAFRSSRIKARCQAGSLTVSWNDALGVDENHYAAAAALRDRLNWGRLGKMVSGSLPDGSGECFVFVKE